MITFCTCVKNRLDHLQKTYIENLKILSLHTETNAILVNFNCQQATDSWAKAQLRAYIDSERLTYFHQRTAQHFHMSKAKNLSHRLSTGSVLVNLDADAWLRQDLVAQILSDFRSGAKQIGCGRHGINGLLVIRKEDFLGANGYDESFQGWGYEECDLFERVIRAKNYQKADIRTFANLKKIPHSNQVRLANMGLSLKVNPLISNEQNQTKEPRQSCRSTLCCTGLRAF